MKLNRKTIVIGGLPHPIGGVTTFLSRLSKAYSDFIVEFIDLYPHENKVIPAKLNNTYTLIKRKPFTVLIILYFQVKYKNHDFFFNFSTTKSLLFFTALPKFRNTWSLMLHHGDLSSSRSKLLLNYILSKFDTIYVISHKQEEFFKTINSSLPLVKKTSYVPATLVDISNFKKKPLIEAKKNSFKILIGSGFPRSLYQHDLLIDIINTNTNTYLFLFLYGEGDLKDELININHPRVTVFLDENEDVFNYYLSEADLYIRPTLEDSFGIACADAIEFGVPVIASDVCNRYNGVYTYKSTQELMAITENILRT